MHIIKSYKSIKNLEQLKKNITNERAFKIEKRFLKERNNTSEQLTPIFVQNTQD